MSVAPPPQKNGNPQAFTKIRKRDNKTDHSPLVWPANANDSQSPMPCAKSDARPRKDPAAGVGGVAPITTRFWQRSFSPNVRDESGEEAKKASSKVSRRQQEGGRWKAECGMRKAEGGSGRKGSLLKRMARPSKGRQRTRRKPKMLILWP